MKYSYCIRIKVQEVAGSMCQAVRGQAASPDTSWVLHCPRAGSFPDDACHREPASERFGRQASASGPSPWVHAAMKDCFYFFMVNSFVVVILILEKGHVHHKQFR